MPVTSILFGQPVTVGDPPEPPFFSGLYLRALTETGIRVVFVTHRHDLAESIYHRGDGRSLFLRAQREHDGSRTYRLSEAAPLPTSYRRGPVPRDVHGASRGIAGLTRPLTSAAFQSGRKDNADGCVRGRPRQGTGRAGRAGR